MKITPDIERWFAQRGAPLERVMRRIHEIIVGADPRMTAYLKYGTLTFAHGGDLAAFVQLKKTPVTLMFNRGARIPGSFPHLEGEGPTARFMRFADLAEAEALAFELRDLAIAWCGLQGGGDAKSARTKPRAARSFRPPTPK